MIVAVIVLGVLCLTLLSGMFFFIIKQKNSTYEGVALSEEFAANRKEFTSANKDLRIEISQRVEALADKNDKKLEQIRKTVEVSLSKMQKDNAEKLEQMRQTVDEKLQNTLERRLSQSFKLVSERLERVHQGLGDMQKLAVGVGDLKNVLTNVKTRGTWGEIQLGALLEQLLTNEQYEKNVAIKNNSAERVEYAIKIPSKDSDSKIVWLPIDAKFPVEAYHRLVKGSQQANVEEVAKASNELVKAIKIEAKKIREKYIEPPTTTDFAILYLPSEGLYAEITQQPGLVEFIQKNYRVTIAGPSTISALLNALQMGFRSLAIQKRTSEVWQVLGVVKTEFGRFGDLLDKTKKKLQEATNVIDDASSKSRNIESKLNKVQRISDKATPGTEPLLLERPTTEE